MELTDEDIATIQRTVRSMGFSNPALMREDVAQEAALRLLRTRLNPKIPRSQFIALKTRSAARHFARKWSRGDCRVAVETRDPELLDYTATSAVRAIEETDARLDAPIVLRRMPVALRNIYRDRFFGGLSGRDIAKREGVSRTTIERRVRRAFLPKKPTPPTSYTHEKLLALVSDMPAFLASLTCAIRRDVEAWLAGKSVEEIAQRARVRPVSVRVSIYRAFERARQRSRSDEGQSARLP